MDKDVEKMAVSAGFYKKIKQWMIDSEAGKIAYQPFQANGNPYKAKIFIIGATPEPHLQIHPDNLDFYARFLVDSEGFQEIFQEEINAASREYKGCLNFMEWMKGNHNETVVLSYLNSLYVENTQSLKELKKQKHPLFTKGTQLLQEILNEFAPKILIVQGASNWKLFLDQFGDQLVDVVSINESVQQLESRGVVAKLLLTNGEEVNVLACRTLGNFGKTGTSFSELKQIVLNLLQE